MTAQLGAVAASTEIFAWMARNPEHPLARALAKPGHELQHRLATAEPTPEQLEVAEARARAPASSWSGPPMEQTATKRRLPPDIFELPVEKMREGYYTDAYFNHDARRAPRRTGGTRASSCRSSRRSDAYLGGMDEAIAVLKLCSDDWEALTVHALYDGDRHRAVRDRADDRGRLHLVRAPRDRLPRRRSRGGR